MDEKLDVILRLILDEQERQKASKGVADVTNSMDKLEKSVDDANRYLTDQKEILDDLRDSLRYLKNEQKQYVKGSRDYNTLKDSIENVSARIEDQTQRVKAQTKEYANLKTELQKVEQEQKDQISLMQRQAAALNSAAAARSKELADLKEKAAWIERGARPLFALGISSFTAITLLAKKYIDSTEESNELTQRWAASSERVQAAQMRISKIAAESVLPLYEKLADIAEKTADFVEKNPGVIEGGLKASIVAAGLGGIGLLVSKGITLYADLKMIAVGDMQLLAANIMATAARTQLAAATGGRVTGAGTAVATAGKVATAGTAGKIAGTAATGAAGFGAGTTTALLVLGTIAAKLSTMIVDLVLQKTGTAAKINSAQQRAAENSRAYPGINPYARNQQAQTVEFSKHLDAMLSNFGTSLSALGITVGATTAAVTNNTAATAMQMESQMISAEATLASAEASNQLSSAMSNVQRISAGASGALSGFSGSVSSAMSSIASSIASFFQRVVSSISGSRGSIGSQVGAPVHDYTGYAYTRTYAMAQDGKRQFVMSGDMTRIAEQMLGGQLTQQAVLSAIAGGSGQSIHINDQRRFSGEYTKSMRRAVHQDTVETLSRILK